MIEIESGIPAPPPMRGEIRETLDLLEIGQSFVVQGNPWNARTCIYNYHHKHKDRRFRTLRLGNGTMRVWRVA